VKRVATRTRKKGPLKLRFHHQALPPEYLNHYETQQQNQQIQENLRKHQQQQQQQHASITKKKTQVKSAPPVAVVPVQVNNKNKSSEKSNNIDVSSSRVNNENIINWLQNVLDMQNKTQQNKNNNNIKINEIKAVPKTRNIPIVMEKSNVTQPSRTQSLKDLPYMGEMTLENRKPRRGRKPKKADICHLIYKNYGTIIPGSNAAATYSTTTTSVNTKSQTTKNLIADEKKLSSLKKEAIVKVNQSEPLNLCIRESNEDTSILISDDNDSNEKFKTHVKSSMIDQCENSSIDLEFSSTIPALISPLDLSDLPATNRAKSPNSTTTSSATTPTSGYVYWPSAGIFIHPMALYYQKMMNNKLNVDSSESSSTSSLSSMMNQEPSTPLWDNDFEIKSEESLNSPPVLSEMLKNTTLDPQKDGNTINSNNVSQKRKRSAIFIPPVQTDTANSPTNEVSICKFKFTGGAKPSLQEKKILSVDSGGNFRYYSGTGDKNMRGYEFFPRENLMQSSLACSSHTNAFLNATSEKIPLEFLPPINNNNNNHQNSSNNSNNNSNDLNTKLFNLGQSAEFNEATRKIFDKNYLTSNENENERMEMMSRKKKSSSTTVSSSSSSHRSTQRAKLEKTFKEKGFLIQTQQLQSAEGATYCKFRQLKKFTRYLFRSWKDYLPVDENAVSQMPKDCDLLKNLTKSPSP
jgi:hypothetical protein